MSSKKRNVLLAVLGLTPQIVTETLYYLVVKRNVQIHEIRVITTTRGRDLADQLLFAQPDGAFFRFCRDYELDPNRVYVAPTEVIRDQEGIPLEDIRSAEDNAAAGDCILRVVADYKKDPDVRLFCSLAGGRKTMSTFAGFAMQLLAEPGDELLHVLVRPPVLESRRDFFYPPPGGDFVGQNPDGSRLCVPAEEISIDCAEVPFVYLRDFLPPDLDLMRFTYQEIVELTQGKVDVNALDVHAHLDLRTRLLAVEWAGGSITIPTTYTEAALLEFFGRTDVPVTADELRDKMEEILARRNEWITRDRAVDEDNPLLTADPGLEVFRQNRSSWKKGILKKIPDARVARLLTIQSEKVGGLTRYFMPLPSSRFNVTELSG